MVSKRNRAVARKNASPFMHVNVGEDILDFSPAMAGPPVTTILIPFGGRQMRVRIGLLTLDEWQEAIVLFPAPRVETYKKALDDNDNLIPDPTHPDHRAKLTHVAGLRTSWRVVRALEKGGYNLDDDPNMPPAEQLEERIEYIRSNWDAGLLNYVAGFLSIHVETGEVRIERHAESFRPVNAAETEDAVAAEADHDGVGDTDAG